VEEGDGQAGGRLRGGGRAALCVGWVDSTANTVDDERSMLWFAPRKRGSGWSRPNKERIERLDRDGLMQPRGRAVVGAAKADGSWSLLDDVENLMVPPDLAAAFAVRAGSREQWEAFPRSARRGILEWIVKRANQWSRPGP
jgi:uncharacterized protein YdeI (YjbR/CyaY-like superfamily)